MSPRINVLKDLVGKLYEEKKPNRTKWSDWLYENHVLVVANYASDLAKKYGANEEYSYAAALLHDIADAVMPRSEAGHEEETFKIARDFLSQSEYSDDEIKLIVDDAVKYHSCHGGKIPSTIEGKVLATADSFAHLKTDFYIYAVWALAGEKTLDEIKEWTLAKLERDLHNKVQFEDEKKELEPEYTRLKELFSR